jgi:hypothetical protein
MGVMMAQEDPRFIGSISLALLACRAWISFLGWMDCVVNAVWFDERMNDEQCDKGADLIQEVCNINQHTIAKFRQCQH